MEKRKILITLCVTAFAAIGVVAFAANSSTAKLSAGEHSGECVWEHYSAVAPTYFENGSKEYWVCCTHHESTLTQPEVGTIHDIKAPEAGFAASLASTDIRYDAKYEAARIYSLPLNSINGDNAGKLSFASSKALTGITTVEFDGKYVDVTKAGSWVSVGYSTSIASFDNYTGMTNFGIDNDGVWHHYSVDVSGKCSGGSGFVAFQSANGEWNAEARLYVKNLKINHTGGTETEEGAVKSQLFRSYGMNSDYPEMFDKRVQFVNTDEEHARVDKCLKIDLNTYSAATGKMNLQLLAKFNTITGCKFDYKLVNATKTSWGGLCACNDMSKLDIYGVFDTKGNKKLYDSSFSGLTNDSTWHTYVQTGLDGNNTKNTDCDVFFGFAITEFGKDAYLLIDNFEIYQYWKNNIFTESFDYDCAMFDTSMFGKAVTVVNR